MSQAIVVCLLLYLVYRYGKKKGSREFAERMKDAVWAYFPGMRQEINKLIDREAARKK